MKRLSLFLIAISMLLTINLSAQYDIYTRIDMDDVKYSLMDLGKMWTFDDIPYEYWKQTYGFEPTEEWIQDVQKSALEFGGGCSAAFVSADGLIMTNHHCGRNALPGISKEDENLLRDGFYAPTLEEERKINGLFVDQLILIRDVTQEILDAIQEGSNNEEKVENKKNKITELEAAFADETGLQCKVVELYNGGKFSMHCYKRYNDVRLVMAPDFQIAATGWDWDNFTYPRYELDFMFYRAYDENGQPIKSENYFEWSENGASEDDLIFTVGRPGNTDRLLSVSQLEYFRDYTYPNTLLLLNEVYKAYYELLFEYPEREALLLNSVMGWGNGRKSYAGRLMGLEDEYIMAKKRDFEKELKSRIMNDPELNKKYGHLWKGIADGIEEIKPYTNESTAYRYMGSLMPEYFSAAMKIIRYAEQMKLPEDERNAAYKGDMLEETIKDIFPAEFGKYEQDEAFKLLRAHCNFVRGVLGDEHPLVKEMYNGNEGEDAANYLISKSKLTSADGVKEMTGMDPDDILNSGDPFIYFIQNTQEKQGELAEKMKEVNAALDVLNQELGEAVFAAFGDQIPPDATGTLRISDGKIEGYEYNGTIAPGIATYYGLYDRFYSFDGNTYPWGLHERWLPPAEGLDLTTPICFASTNDIVGGNSGSSIINTKQQVVGLVHDGNLESLPGTFIFLPVNNRSVATDSRGLMESLIHVFKTPRLVEELKTGKRN